MYHQVLLVGNLGNDPEMRYLPSGNPVVNFSVATNEKWNGQDGERHERTIWWRVSVFGKAGEACNEYLHKGSKVLVLGNVRPDPDTGGPRIWTGNDGQARASFELVARTVKFLSSRGDAGSNGALEPEPVDDEAEIPF